MTDRDRHDYERSQGHEGFSGREASGRSDDRSRGDERRSWSEDDDDRGYMGRGGNTPYGRPASGSSDRGEGYGYSGGYGDQGGYGSQHGQGGYASPAQGSRYGQTGAEWGRAGYGGFGNQGGGRSGRSYGGGESSGFGYTSFAAERDAGDTRRAGGDGRYEGEAGGYDRDTRTGYTRGGGFGQGYAGGRHDEQGRSGRGGGSYGQSDYGASAQRSRARLAQNDFGRGRADPSYEADFRDYTGGDDRAQPGASGGYASDDDHEPHYRRWRDQQLEGHDRDYDRWRSEQSKRYDDEYRSYRDQRHQSFSKDFGDWRSKSPNQGTSSATTAGSTTDQSRSGSAGTSLSGAAGYGTASSSSGATGGGTANGGSALSSEGALQNVSNGGSGSQHAQDSDKTS